MLVLLAAMGCAPLNNDDPDRDGFTVAQGDCDPLNGAVYPGVGGCPTVDATGCSALPDSSFVFGPLDGHYARSAIALETSGVSEPELSLDRGGEPVSGTWQSSGVADWMWTFHPDAELTPSTDYSWAVRAEEGCEQGTFTTSDVGLPVTNAQALVGRTFEIALDQTYQQITFMLFFKPPYWLRIDAIDGDTAQVTLAPTQPPGSEDTYQYACEATTTATGTWDGSRLHLQGELLPLPVGFLWWGPTNGAGLETPLAIDLHDWSLDLTVHPDGSAATVDHMDFTADTRALGDFFLYANGGIVGGDGTPSNFCTVASALAQFNCSPCEDGVETCTPIQMRGHESPGTLAAGIVQVDPDERENHLCDGSCDNGEDDDNDGGTDDDAECDVSAWP